MCVCFKFLCSVNQCLLCAVRHLIPHHSTLDVFISSHCVCIIVGQRCLRAPAAVAWKAAADKTVLTDKTALTRRGLGSVKSEACPVVQPMVAAAGIQQRRV